MPNFINWGLILEPVNWLTVILMLTIMSIGLCLLTGAMSGQSLSQMAA